jgi:hypothetical protein
MSQIVHIQHGRYRNFAVENKSFPLVEGLKKGKLGFFVTVDSQGEFGPEYHVVRIKVNPEDCTIDGKNATDQSEKVVSDSHETDVEIMNRIETRFNILQEMTGAAINGRVRAMIVTGPPGLGKSYTVENQLEKAGIFNKLSGNRQKYEIIKGNITPVSLYCTLYKNSDKNNVLVFDDVDALFYEDTALNVLKAALDSGRKRRIYWSADSNVLKRDGVPTSFDFYGSVIFITNLCFSNVKSNKLQDHLLALQSRCHYIDLGINTVRERILRLKQIHRNGELFSDFDFTEEQANSIIDFMIENKDRLREISLRMAIKIADLVLVSSKNWKELAKNTCMVGT